MTKRQRQTRRSVRQILEALNPPTGKDENKKFTLGDFARQLGVSVHTVKSWTRKNKPLPLSRSMENRIMFQFGASIQPDGNVRALVGNDFSKASVRHWRENFLNHDDKAAAEIAQKCSKILWRVMFAALPTNPGQQNRVSDVVLAFNEWTEQVCNDFKLLKRYQEINDKEAKQVKPAKPTRR